MSQFSVTFWGTRGSIPCPTPHHLEFGGNTSCLHVEADGQHLVFDAGTGIRLLGEKLSQLGVDDIGIFLTHTHWDHISGFPFFGPLFEKGKNVTIRAGHLKNQGGLRSVLEGQMARPMFPVPLTQLSANLKIEDFECGATLTPYGPDLQLKTAPLNHPGGATGYRIEFAGKSLCYVTDTEHSVGKRDKSVLALIDQADCVIYDSTYTDEEFASKVGWGHSTWQEGVRLCQEANAKKLVIFHHAPEHNDDQMKRIEREAHAMWKQAHVAREGETIVLL